MFEINLSEWLANVVIKRLGQPSKTSIDRRSSVA